MGTATGRGASTRLRTSGQVRRRPVVRTLAGSCAVALVVGIAVLTPSTAPLALGGYSDLADFPANYGGTAYPLVLAQGRDGDLYGVTQAGGAHGKGSVYRIGPDGSNLTTLYSFTGSHGRDPVGGLTLGLNGDLYGTAEHGGSHGYGTIFRITPTGTLTVIYNFKGKADGGYPVSPLTLGRNGKFYGTSYPGAAFRVTPAGDLSVLAKIPTTTNGPLLQASDGDFYGVTEFAGKHSAGTVYRLIGHKVQILHSFNAATGSYPVGGVVEGSDDNLYGTTTAGGLDNAGVVYRIARDGSSYQRMVDFDNSDTSEGYQSYAGLVAGSDGKLYGTTIWGGVNGVGVIFSLSTGGGYSVLANFDNPTGSGAYATPIQDTSGELYGVTSRGGAGQRGVVYSLSFGAPPFVEVIPSTGEVGDAVGIIGEGFSTTSGVTFNGAPASFHVSSDTYMTATVPSGETGFIAINTSAGTLYSNTVFRVKPQIRSFSPSEAKVGDAEVITGKGLVQTSSITCGGARVTAYTVNSDSKVTFTVPHAAKTGRITVQTPGGTATSVGKLTVKR